MKLFASQLRERAAELGISHAEVARRSGLTERRFSNYATGIREPDLATLLRIAGALQTTPDSLLGVVERRDSSPRSLLMDRLISAAQPLADEDLEIVIRQVKAFADYRRNR